MGLQERWLASCEDVARVCTDCGRDPQDVKIIAVSKTVGLDVVGQAVSCGITDFGENREKPFNEKLEAYPQA